MKTILAPDPLVETIGILKAISTPVFKYHRAFDGLDSTFVMGLFNRILLVGKPQSPWSEGYRSSTKEAISMFIKKGKILAYDFVGFAEIPATYHRGYASAFPHQLPHLGSKSSLSL